MFQGEILIQYLRYIAILHDKHLAMQLAETLKSDKT